MPTLTDGAGQGILQRQDGGTLLLVPLRSQKLRRLLARIHRLTLDGLRRQIQPARVEVIVFDGITRPDDLDLPAEEALHGHHRRELAPEEEVDHRRLGDVVEVVAEDGAVHGLFPATEGRTARLPALIR